MKKVFLALLIVVFMAAPGLAGWSVTVTWTKSVGPNLDYEEVVHDGMVKCTVPLVDTATCNFTLETLGGDVLVRSYNTQGAFSETVPVSISELPAPAPNVLINVTYVSP